MNQVIDIIEDHLYYTLALVWLSVVAFGMGLVMGLAVLLVI
jgi:hypothetical protein